MFAVGQSTILLPLCQLPGRAQQITTSQLPSLWLTKLLFMVWKNEQEKRPSRNNSVEKKRLGNGAQSGRIKKKKRVSDRRVERRREKIDNKWVSKCYRLHVQPLLSVPVQWRSGSDAETWHCARRRDFFSLVKSGWLSRGTMVSYRTTCYCPSISASKVWTNELPGVPLLLCPPMKKNSHSTFYPLPSCLYSLWEAGNLSKHIKNAAMFRTKEQLDSSFYTHTCISDRETLKGAEFQPTEP